MLIALWFQDARVRGTTSIAGLKTALGCCCRIATDAAIMIYSFGRHAQDIDILFATIRFKSTSLSVSEIMAF